MEGPWHLIMRFYKSKLIFDANNFTTEKLKKGKSTLSTV